MVKVPKARGEKLKQVGEARPDENAGEGEAEYWLSRRVMIEAVVGDRGFNGIDLLWRKRY